MKFFNSKTKKLPSRARKSLLPSEEFLAQGKERFLAAFDASPLAVSVGTHPGVSRWTIFVRAGVGAMAVIAVAVGISAYAATANILPTSPLYPVKRFTENVQLAVAPASAQAQLQATFAIQRANEIDALQIQHPTSTLIPKLTDDLDIAINTSLTDSNQAPASSTNINNNSAGSVTVFCDAFDKSTSSVLFGHLESGLVLHPGILNQFNKQCGTASHRKGQQDTVSGDAAGTIDPAAPVHPSSQDGWQRRANEETTTVNSLEDSIDASTTINVPSVKVSVPHVKTPSVGGIL